MPAESAALPGEAIVTPSPSPIPSTNVLNVFPEIAVALKRLESPLLIGLLRVFVRFYLSRADRIVAIGETMRTRLVETVVRFKRLETAEIDAYLASGEWRGKAGGYAIQGRAAAFVAFLSGSYSNVVGLPLFETVALLDSATR